MKDYRVFMDESILQTGAVGVKNSERLTSQALVVVLMDLRIRR
ncbi:hypothetical protein [Atlantibacter subterraneus]|nr:hypothetical protein [Atlantibacter subterranea]MDW2744004.1 hypothetical protein [Atlantibacter subterranea]